MSDRPDFSPTSVDVKLLPVWQAELGNDKEFGVGPTNTVPNDAQVVDYVVAAGKILYITQFAYLGVATNAADKELNQMCSAEIEDMTLGIALWQHGGNGGGGAEFATPIIGTTGHTIRFAVINRSNHNQQCGLAASGYEV